MASFSRKFKFVPEKNLHFQNKFIAKGDGDDEIYLLSVVRARTDTDSLFKLFMKVLGSPFLKNIVTTIAMDKNIYVFERPYTYLEVSTFLEEKDPFQYQIFNQMREAMEFLHFNQLMVDFSSKHSPFLIIDNTKVIIRDFTSIKKMDLYGKDTLTLSRNTYEFGNLLCKLLDISSKSNIAKEMIKIVDTKWTGTALEKRPENLKKINNLPVFWDKKKICIFIANLALSLQQSKEIKDIFEKTCSSSFNAEYSTTSIINKEESRQYKNLRSMNLDSGNRKGATAFIQLLRNAYFHPVGAITDQKRCQNVIDLMMEHPGFFVHVYEFLDKI
jgi:rRNA maturation protein Rpf1